MSKRVSRSRTSLGWQAGCWRLFNGASGHDGGIKAETQVGLFANGVLVIAPGKTKVKAPGTCVMRDVAESVAGDVCVYRHGLETDGALAIQGAMMAACLGRLITIEPGVSLLRRVELAPNKVYFTFCVSLEGAKSQNN